MTQAQRAYETLCIVDPELGEEARKGLQTKTSAIVEDAKGTIHAMDDWGRKKLAYPIRKKNEGFYFLLTYSSTIEARDEVERILRLNEDVMRSQTIAITEEDITDLKAKLEKAAATEVAKAESEKLAAAEAAKVAAAKAAEPAEAPAEAPTEAPAEAAPVAAEAAKATEPAAEATEPAATEPKKEEAPAEKAEGGEGGSDA